MSAQLQEQPPLFHIDVTLKGKPQRMAESVPRETVQAYFANPPYAGTGMRAYRADREKPLPLKLAHSIRRSCERHQDANHSVQHKAKLMAEHIKRTGQIHIALFYQGREAWPNGVPSSVREFNEAITRELAGGQCLVTYVDPSKDVTSHDD